MQMGPAAAENEADETVSGQLGLLFYLQPETEGPCPGQRAAAPGVRVSRAWGAFGNDHDPLLRTGAFSLLIMSRSNNEVPRLSSLVR